MKMNSIYLVMPAYNEEANIEDVIRTWYPILEGKSEKSRLIIADTGSNDRTHEIIELLRENGYPKLESYSTPMKQHGPKLLSLYNFAIKNKIDYVFQTDSDGQTNPKEFEEFWKLRSTYDVILGERKVRGDGKQRAFVEKVVCIMLWLFFGVKVPDANAPFRLMKTEIIAKYIRRFPSDYNIPNVMFTAFFSYYREKLVFREISFNARQGGENSINIIKIVKIGWASLKQFYEFKREMKKN